MAIEKKQRTLACPPREFAWVENIDDLDKLNAIYAKLESLTGAFSGYKGKDTPVCV